MSDTRNGPEVSWHAVNVRRLRRHRLLETEPARDAESAARVAGAMCGAHAQVLSAAELSLALRLGSAAEPATRQDVRRALWTDRTLVKTYGARGTVHLLPTAELPLWSGALGALGQHVGVGTGGPELLTPTQIDTLAHALDEILADAELTTDELTEALVSQVGDWTGELAMEAFQDRWPRWRWATHLLAYRGALCFAPNKGRRVAYTSPRRWSPDFQPLEGTAAVRELARRYLHGYGPATTAEFARWLAAPRSWAERALASLGEEIEPVRLNDAPAWQLTGDELPDERPHGVRLLPYFDAFGVGSHPRELLFPGRAFTRALARGQAGNYPLLLIDGQVAGVWHGRRSGTRLHLTVEAIAPLSATRRRAVEEQAERVAHALEAVPEVTFGEIAVGPHA